MTVGDVYPWLKALHVAPAITFVSGIFMDGIALALSRDGVVAGTALQRVRRWEQRVTIPAMLLVWILGLTLALQGGWFRSGWLPMKPIVVVALSALHGVQSGALRRLASGREVAGGVLAPDLTPAVLAGLLIIAVLAVVKPF